MEDEVITHHSRRLTTQDFQGKESSFVGMNTKEIATTRRLFSREDKPKFTRPIHETRTKRGLLREAFFAVRCKAPTLTNTAFAPALLDTGATQNLISTKMLIDMFGEEAIKLVKPFHGNCVRAGQKEIKILGIIKMETSVNTKCSLFTEMNHSY